MSSSSQVKSSTPSSTPPTNVTVHDVEDEEDRKLQAKMWAEERALSIDERRARYACGGDGFLTMAQLTTWADYKAPDKLPQINDSNSNSSSSSSSSSEEVEGEGEGEGERGQAEQAEDATEATKRVKTEALPPPTNFTMDEIFNSKLCLWRGDITKLEIDAIVNAANERCLGGGGIDGAIHRAASDLLYDECQLLQGCKTGNCKITRGYALPSSHVIHAVGPIGQRPTLLASCYRSSLEKLKHHQLRSIAFCSISTGIYGYPIGRATAVAVETVRRWLEESAANVDAIDLIIFCVFSTKDEAWYVKHLSRVFPRE